jgi:hypothetical protein
MFCRVFSCLIGPLLISLFNWMSRVWFNEYLTVWFAVHIFNWISSFTIGRLFICMINWIFNCLNDRLLSCLLNWMFNFMDDRTIIPLTKYPTAWLSLVPSITGLIIIRLLPDGFGRLQRPARWLVSDSVNFCWPSPAQLLLVSSPAGLMAILYRLTTSGDVQLQSLTWHATFWTLLMSTNPYPW